MTLQSNLCNEILEILNENKSIACFIIYYTGRCNRMHALHGLLKSYNYGFGHDTNFKLFSEKCWRMRGGANDTKTGVIIWFPPFIMNHPLPPLPFLTVYASRDIINSLASPTQRVLFIACVLGELSPLFSFHTLLKKLQ
jgi:hypothetical protein